MNKLLFLFSFLSIFKIQSQSNKKGNFEFIDVTILKSELIKNDFVSKYNFSLDYHAILTLDYTLFPVLRKMDPSELKRFDISEYKMKRKFKYDFSSDAKFQNIKTLFSNEKLFERLAKGQIKYLELGEKIYTKKNKVAIFETYSNDFSSSQNSKYKVTLANGMVYFELIFSEIAVYAIPFINEMIPDCVLNNIPKK